MATPTRSDNATVIWEPQPGPQTALLSCPVFEVFFGGARGGGKTDGMLGDWVSHQDIYANDASGLMVRRTLRDLEDTIKRSRAIYGPLGARFNEQDKVWRFPNGSEIKYRYLDNDSDADHYQGHSYTRVYVEELTQFASSVPVFKLMATLRSGVGVPCGFRATGNPGGPGHQWVKARYIDPHPTGWKVVSTELKNPWSGTIIVRDRVFIPSKLTENRFLGDEYVANLQLSGNSQLVRAWLEGDWSVIDGAFFSEWSNEQHVIAPFAIPSHWLRFRSGDWGSQAPFSIGWWAVVGDDYTIKFEIEDRNQISIGRRIVPRGALVRYREWYGKVGGKLTAEQVGQGIAERERSDARLSYGVLDPAAFSEDGGPSIAERVNDVLLKEKLAAFTKADNARVSRSSGSEKSGPMGGWDQMRSRMIGTARQNPDGSIDWSSGRPMLYFFHTCADSIRTIPTLQHDPHRAEDLDTSAEDHAADDVRYACMSRPWIKSLPKNTELKRDTYQESHRQRFDEMQDVVTI